MSLRFSSVSMLAFSIAGCGGALTTGTDAGDDGSTTDSAGNTTPIDAGASCNVLAQRGSAVPIIEQASAPPPGPWGGAIQSGTYVLTSFTKFTGIGGANGPSGSLTLTLQISNAQSPDRFDAVYFDGSSVTRASYSGAVGKDGAITLTPLCPAPGAPVSGTYATNGTQLILQVNSETPPSSEIFTKVQ